MWFLQDLVRLRREREAIDALQQQEEWLDGVHWQLDAEGMYIDCEIVLAADKKYSLQLRFPQHYPGVPPSVQPSESINLSEHQYGTNGELCLELGPDNWHPDSHLAANMLESAYRLLLLEAQTEQDVSTAVPSRHKLTDGQEHRTKPFRLILTEDANRALDALDDGKVVRCHFCSLLHQETFTGFLTNIEFTDKENWHDLTFPDGLKRLGFMVKGICVPEEINKLTAGLLLNPDTLSGYLSNLNIPELEDPEGDNSIDKIDFFIFRNFKKQWELYRRLQGGKDVIKYTTIVADTSDSSLRLGISEDVLVAKTVAIVGLGSAGSKITTTLARSGVRNFVLLDDDLMYPYNLVRHDSDWLHIGQHKVDAVGDRLELIDRHIKSVRRKHRLGGQEAATSAASAVVALSKADVIIDATADPKVFNICAHVARQSRKPLAWLEIYAGGVGGLIARARPDKDPEPFTMRAAINASGTQLAEEKEVEPLESLIDYAAANDDEQIVIANDADVTFIAASLSAMVLDILLEREPSNFPNPAYLLGLARSWIFEQPFHIIPVSCSADVNWTTTVPPDGPTLKEEGKFLQQLIDGMVENGSASTSEKSS